MKIFLILITNLFMPSLEVLVKKVSLDRLHWQKLGLEDIKSAVNKEINIENAENVIVFIGSGMGPATITAARCYRHSDMGYLPFERFPYTGILKTYCGDSLTPDSGSAGTAFFCGTKANRGTVGVDMSVNHNDCLSSLNPKTHIQSILQIAQKVGKSTGFVTNGRITQGSITALYAHSANMDWECDDKVTRKQRRCRDLAKQLIHDEPGKNIKVIMGGGRQCLKSECVGLPSDPIDPKACYSRDGRDLINDWMKDKRSRKLGFAFVTNTLELERIATSKVEYVLGIFANTNLKYNYARERGSYGMPSLSKMTEKALNILRNNKKQNGFFLVVENALIDKAHREGQARIALDETNAFATAVGDAVRWTEHKGIAKKTLIIVTSNYAQSLSINGYPSRSSGVLGIAQRSPITGIPYTTLLYTTGGPKNFHYYTDNSNYSAQVKITPYYGKMTKYTPKYQVIHCPRQGIYRKDPIYNNTDDYNYHQHAFILTDEVQPSGIDVTIYAKGPFSHYFHRTHDSTYLYHVLQFAIMSKERRTPFMPYQGLSGSKIHESQKLFYFNCCCMYLLLIFNM